MRVTAPRLEGVDARKLRRIRVQNRIRATITGTRVFDRSLQKTNIWLKEVTEAMGWESRERSYSAMRACLHAVRDLMFLEEAVHFGAQLPMLLRGVYYEGWVPRREPIRLKTIAEFYELVRRHLGPGQMKYSNQDLRRFTRACLDVFTRHISEGEMRDVRGILPKKLRDLVQLAEREDTELPLAL